MKDNEIQARKARVEEIIETLESGDVPLERAEELRAEGEEILEELDELLDVGDGSVEFLNE